MSDKRNMEFYNKGYEVGYETGCRQGKIDLSGKTVEVRCLGCGELFNGWDDKKGIRTICSKCSGYSPDFLKVYNDALKKVNKKKEVFGDGWTRCLLTQLVESLHIHAEKPYWNKRKYDYDDLLDIINYCLFIAVRIKQER